MLSTEFDINLKSKMLRKLMILCQLFINVCICLTIKDKINDYENEVLSDCGGRMDLAIVMDSSSSIGSVNYEKAKEFVSDLVSRFRLSSSNIGFVIFSDESEIIFPLNSGLDLGQMQDKIEKSPYFDCGTSAEFGIEDATKILFNVTKREGVPKIMAIFTDGEPNGDLERELRAFRDARGKNVTIFAIGIGDYINNHTLMNFTNSEERVIWMESYDALRRSAHKINSVSCTVPQTPNVGIPVDDQLNKGEFRYFDMNVQPGGLVVKVDTHLGKTEAFYSYSNENPSSVSHDGQFIDQALIEPRSSALYGSAREHVFVAVEGLDQTNKYTFESENHKLKRP